MKNSMKLLSASLTLSFLILVTVFSFGQTTTNVEALQELSEQFRIDWDQNQIKVQKFAAENNIPVRQEIEDGRLIQMVGVVDGIPVFYTTTNYGAAQTTRATQLWVGGSTGLDLTGEGYFQLGQWDGGHVRASHQEFTDQGDSRVENMDGNSPTHYHAQHVAGTLIAAGVKGNAKGMAYEGNLKAWEWSYDNAEMAQAAEDGLEISNHSYNIITGWYYNGGWTWHGNSGVSPDEDYKFGFYSAAAANMDEIAYNAPNYLIVRSAGNDRGEGPNQGSPENDGGPDGYDCIPIESISKNILTVGAVNQVSNYTGPGSVVMSSFSSWGPADDGRIKPDIVGKGVNVYSTDDGSDTDYQTLSGTSMSSPNVAGTASLLQQYYQSLHGVPMRSATLKGLIIHSADEAGSYDGPDYKFGWGLMNAERAVNIITGNLEQRLIDELVQTQSDYFSRAVTVSEGADLRVTICWTDPKGSPVNPSLNPRNQMLVNNLNLSVVDENGNTHYPYQLNPENPSAQATTNSVNNIDNVEMVFIENAVASTYTINISHSGSFENGEQAYTLIVTGIDDLAIPDCVSTLNNPEDGSGSLLLNQLVSWEESNYATSYDIYLGTDGDGTETPTNVFNGENFEENMFYFQMDPDTTYYLQIIAKSEQGNATGCDLIWSFSSMASVKTYPFNEQFDELELPYLPFGYQTFDNSSGEWFTNDFFGHLDDNSVLCLDPDGNQIDFDNWLITVPFTVKGGEEYDVSYFYRNAYPGITERFAAYWSNSPLPENMTNMIFKDNSFDENNWLEGSGVIEPEEDGTVFIGFHIYTGNGYGVYLDDITVNGWSVGIPSTISFAEPTVYSFSGKVIVDADGDWLNSDLNVVNIMGQVVYSGKYSGQITLDIGTAYPSGIYVVTLVNAKQRFSKKISIE